MITDPIFYRLFEPSPETFFLHLGMSAAAAGEMAARYEYQAIEVKEIYKLARLSREEVQAMLQVHDIRQTRVYQEAREEGLQEGIEKGIEKGIKEGIQQERQRNLEKMAALKIPAEQIAQILGLDEDTVRQELAKKR